MVIFIQTCKNFIARVKSHKFVRKMEYTKENLYYCGKKVSELTQGELIDALIMMFKENEHYKELYFKSEKDKILYMGHIAKTAVK